MTDREQNCVERVEAKVDKLTEAVTALTVTMAQALQRETDCRTHVQAIHAEVFGVDGDPQRPGLKGQMRDVKTDIAKHGEKFAKIEEKYKGGLRSGWMLVVAVVGALVGAIVTAVARHFLP